MDDSPASLENLRAARLGDAKAWESLVKAYTHRVYSLLVRQCGDRELAEELTQETFVKLYQALRAGRYDEQGRFEPWLFRIAVNALRDEKRRSRRQAQPMDMSPAAGADADKPSAFAGLEAGLSDRTLDPSAHADRREQIQRVHAAMDRMDERDRQILHLRHTAGLSFAEIAETLDEPLGTVLARAHRALAKLRKALIPDDTASSGGPAHA